MTTAAPWLSSGVPEVGQLVKVRDRAWVVADVAASMVVRGGDVPRRIAANFDALISDGILTPLG